MSADQQNTAVAARPVAMPPAKPAAPTPQMAPAAAQGPAKAARVAPPAKAEQGSADAAPKGDLVKVKDMLAAVVTKTGSKKKDAKDVIDAFLAELAKALAAGKPLALPPLGNIRVVKNQEKGSATMLVLKLRMGSAAGGGGSKDTLAPDDEDS